MKKLPPTAIIQIKRLLLFLCLLPLFKLIGTYLTDGLGPDPIADITHTTGIWALNLLFTSLAISPLRKLTHWHWLVRMRRMISMLAFLYASLHTLAYLLFDQFFNWAEITLDIVKRPYLMAGFTSFILMAPLAATSTTAMMSYLGGKNWQALHRLAYPVAVAAVLHYFWLVKRDTTLPTLYVLTLAFLLCARLVGHRRSDKAAPLTA